MDFSRSRVSVIHSAAKTGSALLAALNSREPRGLGDGIAGEHLGTWVFLTLPPPETGTLTKVCHLRLASSCKEQPDAGWLGEGQP